MSIRITMDRWSSSAREPGLSRRRWSKPASTGVARSRLVLVEFNPAFCRILRTRYPSATLVQGDAYSMRRLLETLLLQPAAAVVSGLPLVTKPMRQRLRLIRDAFDLMLPGAPFVQFTYSVA